MADYNKYILNLLEKCGDGDTEAFREYSCLWWQIVETRVNFDEYFVGKIGDLVNDQNSYAIGFLGTMYIRGCGVGKNIPKGIGLYERAIELENPCVMSDLACMYEDGIGVDKNYAKAIELYRKAVAMNMSGAMKNLGLMYETGRGVTKDYDMAAELYEKAVELGNIVAMNNLAYLYTETDYKKKDLRKAVILFEKSANFCNNSSVVNLIFLYEHEDDVKDYWKALDWNIRSKNKKGCLRLIGIIVSDNNFDLYKFLKIMHGPYFSKIYSNLPNSIKNIVKTVRFFNRKIMGKILLRKKVPVCVIKNEINKFIS